MSYCFQVNKKNQQEIYKKTNVLFEVGEHFFGAKTKIESPSSIFGVALGREFKLGAFSHINQGGFIQNCTIGRYCAIATNVKIGNGNHPTNWLSVNACQYIPYFHGYDVLYKNKIKTKKFQYYKHTNIGNDVWIGANVYIKDGVTIGNGAIVGANSVVTKDVEPYSIVAGAPAKLIRYRFSPEIIEELQNLKWWEYSIEDIGDVDFDNIELAIKQLKEKLPKIKKYKPLCLDYNYFVPSRVKFFGLIKKYKRFGKEQKYFCGIKIRERELK